MFSYYRYVVCKFRDDCLTPCAAKGKYIDGQVILSARFNRHTCNVNRALTQVENFNQALLDAVQFNPRRTAFEVYNEVARG